MGILDYFRTSEPDPADMERRYAEAYPELVGKSRDALINEQMKKFEETGARNRATQRVVPAAIARLPTTIIEGVQGIDQIVSSFGERSGSIPENLQRARYRKGGFDKVQEFLAQNQAEWQAANPDASSEQIKEFVSKYQNTPEYIEFERSQIPTVYRINEEIGDKIDNAFAVPTDNLKTNKENIIQNVTQALVPVGVAKGLPTAARIAAEFILPGNQAKTNAGKAAVGLTAGGITAAAQAGFGRDVKEQEFTDLQKTIEPPVVAAVKFPELNTADGELPPVTTDAANNAEQLGSFSKMVPGMTSLGMFAAIGAAMGIRPKMAAQGLENSPVFPSKAGVTGPTTVESAKDLGKAAGGSANYAIDERSPIQRAIAEAEGDYGKGVQGANEVGIHSPSAAGTSKRLYVEHGFLGDQQVTPFSRMDDMRTALKDNQDWDRVQQYLFARSELSNRARYIDEVNEEIQKKYIDHTAAVNNKDVAKANDVMQEIIKLQDDLKTRMEKRFQLQQYNTDELKKIIAEGPGRPDDQLGIATRYVKAFDENNQAWMKQLEKDGLIEPEVVNRIQRVHDGNYAPMIADELKGAQGVSRLFAKITNKLENIDDPQSRLQQRVNPFSQRDIREGADGADFIMDPHNALAKRSNQYHNWREQQLYVRDVVERILNGKNADAVIEERLIGSGGRTAFSDAEVFAMSQKRDLSEFTPVKLKEHNGKTSFFKFKDPLLTRSLMAGPMSSSIFGAAKTILQRGATGVWNVGFAPMSTMLENAGIQMLRPKGTVGPTSYYAGQAARVISPNAAAKTMGAIEKAGPLLKPADMLIGQAEAIYGAANLFWKQNRIRIADNLMSSLESDSGWFKGMLQVPAFRAWATKWAQNTVDTFHDTIEGALLDGKGLTFNTLAKNLEHTREIEKLMDVHVPPALRLVGSAVAEPFTQLKMAITSYRDAAKWMHYNRQLSYEALKKGGDYDAIDPKTVKKLQNEVRTLTGDFTKRMGNSKMQSFDDAIPYFRVLIQANKNFYQRLRSDPMLATSVVAGFIIPKIAFEYEMANWDKEAYDWYYRTTSPYDRAGFIGFVRPDIMYRRRVLGEEIPFSPDHVYKLYSPQEARPYIEATAQAIRAMGAYNAGQKDKVADTSMGTQLAEAVASAFSPAVPPPLAGLLAYNGIRLDTGNVFKGENPIQPAFDRDRVNQMLATDGSITKGIHDTLGAIMGGIGKALAQGFVTGEQNYKKSGDLFGSIWKGATEVKERVEVGRAAPIPWMGNVNERRYRQSAVTTEMYKNREAFSIVMGSRTGGKAFTPDDPLLANITEELRLANKTADVKDFSERYKEIDKSLKAIEDNRSVPFSQRQIIQRDKLKEFHQLSIEQQKWMLQQEKSIARTELQPGLTVADAYKKQFGKDFSLKDFASRMKELKRKRPPEP